MRGKFSALAAIALFLATAGAQPAQAQEGEVRVQWLGQSTIRIISVEGRVILIDPYIVNNPKTPAQFKDLAALGRIDIILVTHGHWDHVADVVTLARMHKGVQVWAPAGLSETFISLGLLSPQQAPRINKGGSVSPIGPEIVFTMTRAEHSSEFSWGRDSSSPSQIKVGGEPAGWIIRLENGFTIYHAGDTAVFADMKFIGDYYKPDLAILPIGGRYTMTPRDAAWATNYYLKPKYVIPVHYGTTKEMTGTPEQYLKALRSTKTIVHALRPGEVADY